MIEEALDPAKTCHAMGLCTDTEDVLEKLALHGNIEDAVDCKICKQGPACVSASLSLSVCLESFLLSFLDCLVFLILFAFGSDFPCLDLCFSATKLLAHQFFENPEAQEKVAARLVKVRAARNLHPTPYTLHPTP